MDQGSDDNHDAELNDSREEVPIENKSNLETEENEMIEDKNVQTEEQISVSSSDEETVKLEIQVRKSQKVFSIWTYPQKIPN